MSIERHERLRRLTYLFTEDLAQAIDDMTKCCLMCDNFDEKHELCSLNGLRPPAKVICYGCECFVDKVPF